MINLKKIITLGTLVVAIGATSLTAFAASNYSTPAEALAGITGKTVESVVAEKLESNKTYGTIANEAGKLEEFKKEVLEMKKDILAQRVADGIITQEEADEIIKALEENQALCDGTGSAKVGKNFNAQFKFGMGNGNGCGNGNRNGNGNGNGLGRGNGLRNGSCGN